MSLKIWDQIKRPPKEQLKTIRGGRLKGMSDIKPQWRLKKMTEVFGPIGIGWYYEIVSKEIIRGAIDIYKDTKINEKIEADEKVAIVDILLYIKQDDEWSKPIPGTGGSPFVVKEKWGFYTSDEAFKMALTDAISVAMKQLGMAADVYMGYWDSKYQKYKEAINVPSPHTNKRTKELKNNTKEQSYKPPTNKPNPKSDVPFKTNELPTIFEMVDILAKKPSTLAEAKEKVALAKKVILSNKIFSEEDFDHIVMQNLGHKDYNKVSSNEEEMKSLGQLITNIRAELNNLAEAMYEEETIDQERPKAMDYKFKSGKNVKGKKYSEVPLKALQVMIDNDWDTYGNYLEVLQYRENVLGEEK